MGSLGNRYLEQLKEDVRKSWNGPTLACLGWRRRPTLSLFSELYSILEKPIRHLVLNEAHYMKNWETATHQAIKDLNYPKIVSLVLPCASGDADLFKALEFVESDVCNPILDNLTKSLDSDRCAGHISSDSSTAERGIRVPKTMFPLF